jgi:hypothetical protein
MPTHVHDPVAIEGVIRPDHKHRDVAHDWKLGSQVSVGLVSCPSHYLDGASDDKKLLGLQVASSGVVGRLPIPVGMTAIVAACRAASASVASLGDCRH